MEVSISIQPGDTIVAVPVGVVGGVPAVQLGRLGGAASLTVFGGVPDLRRLGTALLEAAGPQEEEP